MSARPSLASRLAQAAGPAVAPAPVPAPNPPAPSQRPARARKAAEAPATAPAKARVGKTMVAGYFSPEMARAVKLLAVERGVTVQALIGEALDLVLRQAGKHPMGER
ncbi:ribbon-helix-helix domain-containing protein [uncultured Phenylobacterium sp.]|uniref:ribbon-helix-helix domain-containing protein n=1 Tax=uncultured Phenylobacterium sp. TaxID=349273 RepID=UPI00345DB6AF